MSLKACLLDLDMTLVDSSAIASWRDAKLWSHVRANVGQVRPFTAGTVPPHELPAKLRALGLRVGIVTAAPRWYAEQILRIFGIPYDALVAYEDTEQHKPDPEPLNKCLGELGVAAADAVYVGDAPIDSEASYHAGVFSIGAGWGVRDFESLSSAAPDLLFHKPSSLLKLDVLGRRRYFAESYADRIEPKAHAGSILACGGAPIRYALGRYFTRSDPRHAQGTLTNLLLKYKNEEGPIGVFLPALLAFLERVDWRPDYVVSVPPKPSQKRNRFAALFAKLDEDIEDIGVYPDGLKAVKDVEGYKGLGRLERAEAIRGAFASTYTWNNGKVLLVDDVLTTGETVGECARTLLASGAREVRVVALGRDQQAFARKLCPACDRPMRVRTNGATGERFWGCSGYPDQCRNTESM